MAFVKLELPPGIHTDLPDYGGGPRWRMGHNFRWINNHPNRIGGWKRRRIYTDTNKNSDYSFVGEASNLLHFSTTNVADGASEFSVDWIVLTTTRGIFLIQDDIVRTSFVWGAGGATEVIAEVVGDELLFARTGYENTDALSVAQPTSSTMWRLINLPSGMEVPNRVNTLLVNKARGHVIAGGATEFDSTTDANATGPYNPRQIRWSDPYTYNFAPADANRAGDLTVPEDVVALVQDTAGNVLVGTTNSLYVMQFVGGTDVYRLNFEGSGCGPVGRAAFVTVNDDTYWMSEAGFFHYSGTVMELPCPVKHHLFSDIHTGRLDQVRGVHDTVYDEVFWLYPSAASQANDRYVAYSFKQNYWYFGELSRAAWLPAGGSLDRPLAVTSDCLFYDHDMHDATDPFTSWPEGLLESSPVELADAQGQQVQEIRSFIPDISVSGPYRFSLTGQQYPNSNEDIHKPAWDGQGVRPEYTMTATQRKQDLRLSARQASLCLRVPPTTAGDVVVGMNRLDAQPDGVR